MAVPRVPEQFLRHLWQEQKLPPTRLLTSDGARVTVRYRGTVNTDGGPDFTGALIRIGGVLYRGDVEIHVRESSWRAHGHHADHHYNSVILHVVLSAGRPAGKSRTASGRTVPLLVLPGCSTSRTYTQWVRACSRRSPRPDRCRVRTGLAPLRGRLQSLGLARIERRVRFLRNRLGALTGERGSGAWEQMLYECLMEGMGYAKNRTSFFSLAHDLPLSLLKCHGLRERRTVQAALFGASGLLPPLRSIGDSESRLYVRTLRRRWRAMRLESRLHEADWMFFRLRPANFPTARLAAVSLLLPSLFSGNLLECLLGILSRPEDSRGARYRAVKALFRISAQGYWSRHLRFGGESGEGIALGRARIQELIVNSIVPVLLLYARVSGDRRLRRESLAMLRALPDGKENSITQRVSAALGAGGPRAFRRPLQQQGLIHLHRLYCSRKRCRRCPLRKGERELRTSRRYSRAHRSTSPRR